MEEVILVVEDDPMISKLVTLYLEKEGYRVVKAPNGKDAKRVYLESHPCLIILDLMLPKVSGEAFCDWIRHDVPNKDVPIIMLSAKAQTEDKIKGLRMGADSYVTKPFNPDELMAHVEAVLRRTRQFCQKIAYEGLCIMPRKGDVYLYDKHIQLTRHEFSLLYFLMQHPNDVFTREQLVRELYSFDEQDILDRTIDAHVKKIREKIEEIPAQPKRIQTVRGMGYKFVHA